MRKLGMVIGILLAAGFFSLSADAGAQMGPGMMGPGYGPGGYEEWNCPYCGQPWGPGGGYGAGPGMMGRGYGMGPGYGHGYGMGPGYGRGYGMGPGYGHGYGMGPGMMGPGYGRGYGMGPGYGHGYGMGPGMMGPGYGPQQYGPPPGASQAPPKALEEKDVKGMLENYLQAMRNPNLKLGKVTEKGPNFEAEIVTKDNSLVDKVLVDKNTGWMRSGY